MQRLFLFLCFAATVSGVQAQTGSCRIDATKFRQGLVQADCGEAELTQTVQKLIDKELAYDQELGKQQYPAMLKAPLSSDYWFIHVSEIGQIVHLINQAVAKPPARESEKQAAQQLRQGDASPTAVLLQQLARTEKEPRATNLRRVAAILLRSHNFKQAMELIETSQDNFSGLAHAFFWHRQIGQNQRALQLAQRLRTELGRQLEQKLDDFDRQVHLSNFIDASADIQAELKQPERALQEYQQSRAILKQLLRDKPGNQLLL
ncbi:MAG: hypothetical protein RL748_3259, partial [Pseudomonadota bacterium]